MRTDFSPPHAAQPVWIDLRDPTPQEVQDVETLTGLHVSSAAELQEIESSSRLYARDGAVFMSMPMLSIPDWERPSVRPLGFALSASHLLSIRFMSSGVFDLFSQRLPAMTLSEQRPGAILIGLLEAIVDRLADLMEHVRDELDEVSRTIFADPSPDVQPNRANTVLRTALTRVGRGLDLISRLRDSLLGVNRTVPWLLRAPDELMPHDLHERLTTLREDVQSLNDYDSHLTDKAQFLQDAILGFINIDQNNIIKVLTVVSVVGVPPTLVASVYGMNFKNIPELQWDWGYEYGLAMIVATAVIPLLWFRRRGWL